MNGLLKAFYWIGLWIGFALGICFAGALAGGLLFPVAGSLLGMDLPLAEMLRNGLFDGGFLALIWAPGASFVICLMLAHRQYSTKRDKVR